MLTNKKEYFNKVIKPQLVKMATNGTLPLDMNQLSFSDFEDATKKQVTVVMQIAIAMEVPVNMPDSEIPYIVKHDTSWDVTCDNKNIDVVDVSDVLDITSITEAPLV